MAEVDDVDGEVDEAEEAGPTRSAKTDALWSDIRIDPIEIALPRRGGAVAGYTLRAYRMSDEVTLSEVIREEDDFTILERHADHLELVEDEDDETDGQDQDQDDQSKDLELDASSSEDETDDQDQTTDETDDESESDSDDDSDSDEKSEEKATDEVPVFLGHSGKLYLFLTPESLVDFVRSDEEHDLTQVEGWAALRDKITVDDIVADDADHYELDLVVDNLRGGQDVWDADLLIRAGEIARDLGYALRIDAIVTALAPGSPLDDLDEALRSASSGFFGSLFGRRRLKKIGAQQAALGWRTIIGKISAVTDWRE